MANGHVEDNIASVSKTVTFAQQDSLYLLEADRHFREISNECGPELRRQDVTRGVATADFDGDGLLDMVLTNNGGPLRLMMNRSRVSAGRSVILWLEGKESNRSAIGTRIETAHLRREVRGASSYLSQSDLRVHIGLGEAEALGRMRILWPAGTVQELDGLAPGTYRLVEGGAPQAIVPGEKVLRPE